MKDRALRKYILGDRDGEYEKIILEEYLTGGKVDDLEDKIDALCEHLGIALQFESSKYKVRKIKKKK